MSFTGSKNGAGVFQRIISWMPPHDLYIEPFAGRAAVFRRKRPARYSVLIDSDPTAIDALGMALVTAGGADLPPGVELICGDGLEVFMSAVNDGLPYRHGGVRAARAVWMNYFEPRQVLVYCDPPYLRSTRRDPKRDYYQHEWSREQHEYFLDQVVDAPWRVLISGYKSALYTKRLRGWHTERYRTTTRGGPVEEWIWANFPRPAELHDYRYVGRDYRHRERIRKRQRRWCRMLRAMPALERCAMLAAVIDEFGEAR